MVRPCIDPTLRKAAVSVSLSQNEKALLMHLGCSAYLQRVLLLEAKKLVRYSTPSHPLYQTAQDIINAHARNVMGRLPTAQRRA
jgi:hypothetical protein